MHAVITLQGVPFYGEMLGPPVGGLIGSCYLILVLDTLPNAAICHYIRAIYVKLNCKAKRLLHRASSSKDKSWNRLSRLMRLR